MLKIYAYKSCSTCRNALKWLEQQGVAYQEIAIRETPPTQEELRAMLTFRKDKKLLFNTSGQDYRALGLKDQMAQMSDEQALKMLSENGNLVKRPFVVSDDHQIVMNGFKLAEWETLQWPKSV